MRAAPTFLLLALAVAANAAERIAVLQPNTATMTISGQENGSVTPLEAVKRVVPKFVDEANGKLKWTEFEWIGFDESLKAQGEAMGANSVEQKAPSVRELVDIAGRLKARYVVTFVIRELSSYRANSILVQRKGGRANVGVLVFDAQEKKYVWQSDKTETSIREQFFADESLRAMQDQALFNALRAALQPFVKEGARKEVATQSTALLAKVSSVVDPKQVLLDLGETSGIRKGDELASLDGKVRVRVIEVLANGSIAEVLEGQVRDGLVLRTK